MNIKTAAGIVTYNPDINDLKQNIDAVKEQVDYVVLSDNGTKDISALRALISTYDENVILIYNNSNLGIAAALNIIFAKVGELSCDWVLTLDDDSVCPDNMIRTYIDFLEHSTDNIGILCPVIKDKNIGIIDGCDKPYEYIRRCITSGAFTSYAAWKSIGGFDEKLFIDGVDFDFCDRLIMSGYRVIRIKNTELLHELGHIKKRHILFIPVMVKNHSARRKYYIMRNRVYLSRKEKQKFRNLSSFLFLMKFSLITLLYEKDKKEKLGSIFRGYRDGFNM